MIITDSFTGLVCCEFCGNLDLRINNEIGEIMSLKISIVIGHDRPELVKTRGEKAREFYSQKAYIYNGKAFPEEIKLSFDTLPECLEVGDYELDSSSYRANQYGSLELDRFNLKFNRINENKLSKAS